MNIDYSNSLGIVLRTFILNNDDYDIIDENKKENKNFLKEIKKDYEKYIKICYKIYKHNELNEYTTDEDELL